MTYDITLTFRISGIGSNEDARAHGEALFCHVFDTFNDDDTIAREGQVEFKEVGQLASEPKDSIGE